MAHTDLENDVTTLVVEGYVLSEALRAVLGARTRFSREVWGPVSYTPLPHPSYLGGDSGPRTHRRCQTGLCLQTGG